MTADSIVERAAPDEQVPWARIARFAVYALVVAGVGTALASFVAGTIDLLRVVLVPFPDPVFRLWLRFADLVREALRGFALLVALGVFLTQFEK